MLASASYSLWPQSSLNLVSHNITVCRYVYRFVCDLQSLLGYTPEELHAMVDL